MAFKFTILLVLVTFLYGNCDHPKKVFKRQTEKKSSSLEIKPSNSFACYKVIHKVGDIKISENNSLDCFDENIEITFDINHDNSKSTVHNFLTMNPGCLSLKQNKSTFCRKVRRYYINDNEILVRVNSDIGYIEKNEVEKYISGEFWLYKDYYRYAGFELGYYNEETDSMDWLKIFKDLLATSGLLILLHKSIKSGNRGIGRIRRAFIVAEQNDLNNDLNLIRQEIAQEINRQASMLNLNRAQENVTRRNR